MLKEIKLELTNDQSAFMALRGDALYTLFIGGFGCGKSYTLSTAVVLDMLHCPNSVIGVFAPTVAHVRDVCMRYVLQRLEEFGFVRDKDFFVNKNEGKILPNHPQLCEVWFKTLDDPDSIVGYEFYTAHVDEIDTMPADKAERCWEQILARTRQNPKGLPKGYMEFNRDEAQWEPRNCVSAYSTPEGFKFTHKMWSPSEDKNHPRFDPNYQFVRACSLNNPYLSAAYLKGLREKYKYNPSLLKAYLEGQWVNMQSGSVYYSYNREKMNSEEELRPGEPIFVGCDFNVGKMAAIVFVKRYGGLEWHAIAEHTDMLDTPDLVDTLQFCYQSKGHEVICYPDSTGRHASTTNAKSSDIALLRGAGFRVKAHKKNPFVKDRVAAVNKAFHDGKLKVNSEKCRDLVKALEQQAYDKNGKPDKSPTTGYDHVNDAFGYPIAYTFSIKPALVPMTYTFATKR